MGTRDRSDHFVSWLAHSTGLLAGLFLVDIVARWIGAHPREGNRMSTAKAGVLGLLETPPDDFSPGEIEGGQRITVAKDYPHPDRVLDESEADRWDALQSITAPTVKAEIMIVLGRLPDDCTMQDILEELDEREHLRRGLASALYEPLISQEEMELWFEQWARE